MRLLVPPGQVRQGIGRETLRHLRHHQRQGASHVGLLRRGRLRPPGDSGRAAMPHKGGETTAPRQGLPSLRPYMGSGSLWAVQAQAGWCSVHMLARLRERRRCAGRLTGQLWDAPAPPRSTMHEARRRCTPMSVEGTLPAPSVCVDPYACSCSYRERCLRFTGAAPHPSLHLTGARCTCILSFA